MYESNITEICNKYQNDALVITVALISKRWHEAVAGSSVGWGRAISAQGFNGLPFLSFLRELLETSM